MKKKKSSMLVVMLTLVLIGVSSFVVSPIGVSVGVVDFDGESGDFVALSGVDWWPMFHHDPSHTGYSTSTAPNTNNTIWNYTTGWYVYSSPAVADGKVYVGSYDNKVYAFGPPPGIHDVAVTNVTTSKAGCPGVGNGSPYPVLCQGRTAKVYVTVENQGNFTELFEVSAYCNDSAIPIHEQWPTLGQSETFWTLGDVNKDGYIDFCDVYLIAANYGWTGPPGENPADIDQDGDVDIYDMLICAANYGLDIWTHFALSPDIGQATLVNLPNGSSTTITFRWNATGWAKGNYTIKAVADQVTGEIDTADNTFIDKWVMVVHPGDLDNSCEVDITDVVIVTAIYRSMIGDPDYNACRDVVEDCVIDISDVVAVTAHYRETC